MHELDITYHNTYNCKTLRIEDNSVYDPILAVNNPILEVRPPGLVSYIPFYFPNGKWKAIVLNCSTLKLCCAKQPCKLTELPDGIYGLKYSIDPNLNTIIELSHMRVCRIMAKYIKITGLFLSNRHLNSRKDNEKIEKELLEIKETIDASVYFVEELLDNTSGIEAYNEASNRLNKINNGTFANCCQ